MPPRRARGRRGGFPYRGRGNNHRGASESPQQETATKQEQAIQSNGDAAPCAAPVVQETTENIVEKTPGEVDTTPPQIKVSNMPDIYNAEDFKKYLTDRLKVPIAKVISTAVNHPFVVLEMKNKEDQEKLLKLMENHVWRTKKLITTAWPLDEKKRKLDEDDDNKQAVKKIKSDDASEAIMNETLPFLDTPYEEQNRLSVEDAEVMAKRLHASLCNKNRALLGWAEKSCETNNGFLYKIEPLKVCHNIQGYKNKCKFRIGLNSDRETTVGFVLNENNNKILGVEPGDQFIHIPESMKYAAKKFQDFLRKGQDPPYNKQSKTGVWDNLLIRVAPDGALMLIAILSDKHLDNAGLTRIQTELKEYFEKGDGKDCNVFSLYLQIFQEQHPNYPADKLTLLLGKPDYEENICGLKFYVSPFSILNINPSCSENIYNTVIELAEPTQDSVVIDVCAGSCGIAFTFANKVEKAYAIERKEENIKDAMKSKELNNIANVEIIQGKCEDHLEELFNKLKDKPLIVVLDPPRHGVVSKTVAQIRQQPNVKKVIYVCSNSKTGLKNFLDFSAQEGKEPGSGQLMKGLPFLPIRAIPIDVAPFTANNTVVLLLERVDPSTYPPAKNPAPAPPPEPPRKARNSQRLGGKQTPKKGVSSPATPLWRNRGRGRGGPPIGRFSGPPRPLMGHSDWMSPRPRLPPPSNHNNFIDPSILINKYERRIAELEQQDRAFKAGLSMGMQVGNRGFPPENLEFDRPNRQFEPWQSNSGQQFNNSNPNPMGYGPHAVNNGPPAPSGYGAHASGFGGNPTPPARRFSNPRGMRPPGIQQFANRPARSGGGMGRGGRPPRRARGGRF